MSRRVWGGLILSACVGGCLAFGGCGDGQNLAGKVKPNVLLISLDTTRADYIGCYGMSDVKTPAM